jgi:hypothetical protein
VKFVDDCSDFGAPEYCVAGVSSVERISQNMVRVIPQPAEGWPRGGVPRRVGQRRVASAL